TKYKTRMEYESLGELASKQNYIRWKTQYPEFKNRVDEALEAYRKRTIEEQLHNILEIRRLAKKYVYKILNGEEFTIEERFNGKGELIERISAQVKPPSSILTKFLEVELGTQQEEITIRVVRVKPPEMESADYDDDDLSID